MSPLIVDAEMMGRMGRSSRVKIEATISNPAISRSSDTADLLHFTAALWFVI